MCCGPDGTRAPQSAEQSLEYAVKAAYLAKFVPFIDWPDGTFTSPGAAINICVLGGDPFRRGPGQSRRGAIVTGERPLAVRRLASPDPASRLPDSVFGRTTEAVAKPACKDQRDRPVVTVTVRQDVAGIISFVIDGNHVRFDIDNDAATHSGVHISSKLLSLAHAMKRPQAAP